MAMHLSREKTCESRSRSSLWRRTVGLMETCPQNLRTAKGLWLTCRSRSINFWTRDLIPIHNGAFLRIVGNKHWRALGQKCWAGCRKGPTWYVALPGCRGSWL